MEINLNQIKKIHFVGIGGVGISAIARLMHTSGKIVTGSDVSMSHITDRLSALGIEIFIGQDEKNIKTDVDLVIHTIAIPDNNPELTQARLYKIETRTYPQMLALISRNMLTVAISGTHGKTTTTAMLADICTNSLLDPTVIVGSLMKDSKSNLIVGQSNYFLVEACEYRRSFLNLYPTILAITNIDMDHLDYYKNLTDIQSAFRELALRVPKTGAIICNPNDPNLAPILKDLSCIVIDYTLYINTHRTLKIPGLHNHQNAAVAHAIAHFLTIDDRTIEKSLTQFNGTWRRFDFHGKTKNGALLYDDYAHHPTEIRATLQGLKEMYPHMRRVVFFQPHLFSRTKSLLKEFSKSFSAANETYILPIYASREEFDPTITSEMLVDSISDNTAFFIKNFDDARAKIQEFDENTVIITMGAGNIYNILKKD